MKDVENQPVAEPDEPPAPSAEMPEIETFLMTVEELEYCLQESPTGPRGMES